MARNSDFINAELKELNRFETDANNAFDKCKILAGTDALRQAACRRRLDRELDAIREQRRDRGQYAGRRRSRRSTRRQRKTRRSYLRRR